MLRAARTEKALETRQYALWAGVTPPVTASDFRFPLRCEMLRICTTHHIFLGIFVSHSSAMYHSLTHSLPVPTADSLSKRLHRGEGTCQTQYLVLPKIRKRQTRLRKKMFSKCLLCTIASTSDIGVGSFLSPPRISYGSDSAKG